jgi:hypothetical protein
MTLAELAFLVAVEPKWVLNTLSALERSPRYSMALARRLAITHAIVEATSASVPRAFDLAGQALRRSRADEPLVVSGLRDDVGVWIDLPRILSSFNVRLSLLRTTVAPRQRGRPPRRRNPLKVASAWGIDLTLLADNARKSKEQRLRQLDAMVRFASEARRVAATDT